MIDAAQSALFVAPERERCEPMRAAFVNDAELAAGVAEDDQTFAVDLLRTGVPSGSATSSLKHAGTQ